MTMITHFNWSQTFADSPITLVLVGFSVITLAVTLERAFYYWKRRANPDAIFNLILQKIGAGDTDAAIWLCRTCRHPMGAAALPLFHDPKPGESSEEGLQIALSEQKLLLERNLGILGTMAAVAPLVGLLGTVWGIMRAFHDMSLAGSAAPTVVAAGVAEALITTAIGLVVAVPAVLLYNHFARSMSVMLTVAENHARTIRAALNGETNEMHVVQTKASINQATNAA
jgi:biopolymer transport protein ExbB